MRLLTDSSEGNEDSTNTDSRTNIINTNTTGSTHLNAKAKRQHNPYHRFNRMNHHHHHHHHHPHFPHPGAVKMKNYQSVDSLSSDDSSINSSPSPTDYMLDMMYGDPVQQQIFNMLQFKDLYDPMITPLLDTIDPLFTTNSDIITPLLTDEQPVSDELLLSSLNMIKCTRNNKLKTIPSQFSLWPNYICLYLEYSLPQDPCGRVSHNLSQLPHCYANCLSKISTDALPKDKCPPLMKTLEKSKDIPLLLAKVTTTSNLYI